MPELSKFATKFSSRGLEKLIELSKAGKRNATTSYLESYEH